MKKVLLLIALYSTCAICYAQDLRFAPLEDYGVDQKFPFGYSVKNNDYQEYAKNKKKGSTIKNNEIISNIFFYEDKSKSNIYGIGLRFKNKKDGEAFLTSLDCGNPETYTSISDLGYTTNTTIYNRLYYNDFIIQYKDMNHIEVYCYDYAPYVDRYDEFEKIRTSFLDINYKLDCNAGISNSNFIYFSKNNNPTISFSFSYTGTNWMFANEVIFLLDNGDTIKVPLEHSRNLDGLICKETCIADIDFQQAEILSQQKSAKYKVSGEKFNIVYSLNPALISSLHYIIECYNGISNK